MAFIHGKNAKVVVSGTNISSYCDSSDMSTDTDLAETSTYGDNWKTNVAGMSQATLNLGGKYDATSGSNPIELLEPLRSTSTTVVWYPQGQVSGLHVYSGSYLLSNLSSTAPIGGIVAWNASLTSDGEITRDWVLS